MLPRGSAIAMISSAAGLGWEKDLDQLKEYLDTPDFAAAVAWIEANPGHADYMWSKKTICAYVARESFLMLKKGIRLNAILPGPTDTPLAQANAELWLTFGQDYRDATGIEASTPEEQADVLAFLNSHAARYINGVTLVTDAGYVPAGITGAFPDATPVVDFLRGNY
jgi:NAD(P)-dependent dehydrogenase (short-subunit alcohol dehydrogenase family)